MKIQIRKSEDIMGALDIARKNSHFFNSSGITMMKQDFKIASLIGAFYENKIVGFIAFKELNDQAVELAWMAVEPVYQNQGIGTSLVKKGLELLPKKYHVCEMKTLSEVDSDLEYAKTRKFYKKLGFIPLETICPYKNWGEDNPCQIFVKILQD